MKNLFQSKEAEQDIHLISLLTLSANVTRRPDLTVKEELRRLEVSLRRCLSRIVCNVQCDFHRKDKS